MGILINRVLEKAGRPERFRTISAEGGMVAEGIWTVDEALKVADGIILDSDDESGGQYFYARGEDYIYAGDTEDNWEFFKVDPEIIKILINSNIFVKNKYGDERRYKLIYPKEFEKCGISVEMSHYSLLEVPGEEGVTLHFMI